MQQFVVPQFIEVEDKIFGPITTRQFLILLFAAGIIFLGYRFGSLATLAFTIIVVGGLAVVFAFVKINGQTFHYFILNIIQTKRQPRKRIWQKGYTTEELNILRMRGIIEAKEATEPRKVAKRRRIRDLSLIVNTGGYYQGE